MRLVSYLVIAGSILIATAAAAAPAEQRFERDGEVYAYTASIDADGRRIVDGRRLSSGGTFHLVIANGRVTGTMNGAAVAFALAEVPAPATTLAAN